MIPQYLSVCIYANHRRLRPSKYGGFAMRNQLKRTPARALRALVAMLMVLCLFTGMVPEAFAAQSVGSSSDDVSPSEVKTYIKLSASVPFFTGETSGTGTVINPIAGTVAQLVSTDWYLLELTGWTQGSQAS